MKKKFLFAALFCLLAALAAGAVYEYRKQQAEAAVLTGTVEATKADITPKQSGYIEKLFVKESDAVTTGETAALLSRKDLEAALLRDEAAYRASLAALEKAENGNRPEEIRKAASETAAARAESDRAGRDYARMKALLEADAVSRQDYDAAKEARDSAAARLAAAEEYQALMESGARAEDIEYARRTAEQNRAARDIAREAVADLTVRVPVSGVILTKNYEEGEYVQAGAPIATVADLSDCWVKVYVSSEELGRLRIGQKARVSIDGAPGRTWEGYIKEISESAEYTPRQSITRRERENLVFAVKVAVPNEDGLMKPGMPADVIFP